VTSASSATCSSTRASQQGAQLYGVTNPAGSRMHTASQFFQHLHQDMTQAAEHWRHALAN
jgi:hypothetical protein